MVQAHNNGCLNQGGFGGVGREEVRFWILLQIVLTGVKENSKFIGLHNWEDGVVEMGKFVGRCLGWDQSAFRHVQLEKSFRDI